MALRDLHTRTQRIAVQVRVRDGERVLRGAVAEDGEAAHIAVEHELTQKRRRTQTELAGLVDRLPQLHALRAHQLEAARETGSERSEKSIRGKKESAPVVLPEERTAVGALRSPLAQLEGRHLRHSVIDRIS